eukprot:378928-Amphidinium_carterae.1
MGVVTSRCTLVSWGSTLAECNLLPINSHGEQTLMHNGETKECVQWLNSICYRGQARKDKTHFIMYKHKVVHLKTLCTSVRLKSRIN